MRSSTASSSRMASYTSGAVLERVAGADGVWLQDSPENLMVINSVFTLDAIDLETLRALWEERVMQVRLPQPGGGRRYPRFTQRVVLVKGKACWQEQPDFDLDRHVFIPEGAGDLDTREKIQGYVARLASRPLPEDLPRWQLQLIPRFGSEGGSAVIVRIHHCMGDGIALVPVIFSLLDGGDAEGRLMPAVMDRGGKPPNRLLLALRTLLLGPFLLLAKMLWRPDRNPLHGPALSGDKRVAWSGTIDLGELKALKNELGVTLNDVMVACVAGGLRRYAHGRGSDLRRLRASMPVNVRSRFEELRMDNKFAAVLLPLDVAIADLGERVAATHRRMVRLKRSIEPFFTYVAVRLMLKLLPAGFSRLLIDFLADKCTCVLTNVPGPQVPAFVAGRRLRAMLFWVPQRSSIGIGISILTLAGGLRLGVISDTAVVPDPEVLVRAFEDEIAELRRRRSYSPSAAFSG